MLKTENLTKYYGKNLGVENLNLEVQKGEIFGFLGPNGAGKTTTINLLLDLIRPTAGSARVFDMDPRSQGGKIRSRIGFLPGEFGFYENMKGFEYLRFFAGLRKKNCDKKIKELAEYFFNVDLTRGIKSFSKGMKQLLGIIQAFMASPDLYILDEPTSNLDPLMKQRFYKLAENEVKNGKTIFLSSHMLDEVERLCKRVCIIKKGHVVTMDSIESLREKMTRSVEVTFKEHVDPEKFRVDGVSSVSLDNGRYIISINGDLNRILSALSEHSIMTFDFHKMSLEEIFMQHFAE